MKRGKCTYGSAAQIQFIDTKLRLFRHAHRDLHASLLFRSSVSARQKQTEFFYTNFTKQTSHNPVDFHDSKHVCE